MRRHCSPGRLAALTPLLALTVTLTLALMGCGTQGYAPGLGKAATVALAGAGGSQSLGSATFTPFYAAHIATYYEGKQVPYAGALTPVELRSGDCTGKPVAALTEATSAPIPGGLAVAADANSGVDVATATNGNLYIVVRARANDASAPLLACGHPLSQRQQYFDLYTPSQGANGYALGIALMQPILATRVSVALTTPSATAATWAVRTGSCSGAVLAQGQIAAGARDASGVVFAALDAGHWRLTLTSGGQTLCQTVGA